MNQRNYQKELDKIIEGLEKEGRVPSLLLHSCCAPCSSYVLEYLSRYFAITVFYYNPNIYPPEEYVEREAEQERLISVRLKFSPAAAFRVYDEFTDTVEKDAQGSLYVTIDMPERTLYSYILSYGDAVEILEPDELRRSMKEKLTRMAEKYKT